MVFRAKSPSTIECPKCGSVYNFSRIFELGSSGLSVECNECEFIISRPVDKFSYPFIVLTGGKGISEK